MLTSLESRELLRNLNLTVTIQDATIQILESAHGRFGKSFPRHMHNFYELHYLFGGVGKLLTDDASMPLRAGDLFLIPPHYYHEQLTDPVDLMEEFHISFSILPSKHANALSYALNTLGFTMLHTTVPFGDLYQRVDMELLNPDSYTKDILEAIFQELLIRIFRLMLPASSETIPHLSGIESHIIKIDQIILFQYATISLQQLAENLNLSKNHTCRLIKEHYGMTVVELRSTVRLGTAADLLITTTRSISDISDQCGFSNPIYFTQEFKKQFHMTPRDYRKQHHESL